jgi:hypothetical protein
VKAAARAIVRTSAIAPRHDAQLCPAETGEILRTADDVPRQCRDFFFHRREASGATVIRTPLRNMQAFLP